jgi:hypothetical protein
MLPGQRKENPMNLKGKLLLAIAALVLGTGVVASAQTAYTFDWNAFDRARSQAIDPVDMVVDGFGSVRDLARLALATPTEAAEKMHLEYILTILEGSTGPNTRLDKLPIEAVYSASQLTGRYPVFMYSGIFGLVGGTQRGWELLEEGQELFVAEGGAVGAAAAATPFVSGLADFVRENQTPLVAYYAAAYGTDGEIVLNAHLSSIEAMQSDIDMLARHALAAALDALNASDSQTRRGSLLDLYAYSIAICGLDPTVESRDREQLPHHNAFDSYGWTDPSSLGGTFLRAEAQLYDDMTDALAATVSP